MFICKQTAFKITLLMLPNAMKCVSWFPVKSCDEITEFDELLKVPRTKFENWRASSQLQCVHKVGQI